MKLSEVSVRRPVLATVMSLAIVLIGAISFTRLPVREYPDIDPPVVSVTTLYRGASPSVVETEITNVLEEQFATLEGVKSITSSSREQGSIITVEFELGQDVNEAANDIRDRVSRMRGSMPAEVDDPVVAKVDANASAIVWLALYSDLYSQLELSEVADLVLKEHIQRLPGVGSVIIGGERRYAMRVWLDPQRMAAHGLTTQDIETAIRRANAEIPSGRVEGTKREFAVRTRGDLVTPEEFGAIILTRSSASQVRLRDVAEVEIGAEDERSTARWNGRPAVGLGIVKQSRASTLDVARALRSALPEMKSLLPPGMALDVAYDSATFIEESVEEVRETMLIAAVLVVVVVLVFLKSLRATLIPSLAIPVSIIGTFAVAYFAGFTINILSLLALVLAIGLVVDDAIVILENVFRHMEMGKSRRQAAIDGTREIGFAVVATTVALVAVFVPVAFLTGAVGRLFNEFGISLASAVVISSFVALSLSPMLCSRILRLLPRQERSGTTPASGGFFGWLNRFYTAVLLVAMKVRWLIVLVALLMVAASAHLFELLPRELVPTEDRGIGFGMVIAPEGATLDYTDHYMREVEKRLLPLPERRGLFTAIGLSFGGPGQVTNGIVFLPLKPRAERQKSQQQIIGELFPQMMSIPGVLAFIISPPSMGGGFSSSPVEYVLQADSYELLNRAVEAMMAKASELGYLINLDTDLRLNKPQLDITIDRQRAAALGVSVMDIGTTLETFLGGRVVSQFKRGTKQHDVIVQMKSQVRATPDAIAGLYLRGTGGLVQLANVVQLSETVSPKELNHYNRLRAAKITANLAPGVDLGTALDALDRIAARELPGGVKRELGGQSREYRESSDTLYFMFVLAVVFIYLVLAAQFESFVHPLTILFAVPLALFGALVALFFYEQSLNIYSQIGLIMLVGLVTKNAILIVEYANQLRARGREVMDAVVEAATIRLRPILMTSLTVIFGVLPIAIGFGAGAESRRPLGIVIVGGLFFSTFLTLVLVPVIYTLLGRFTRPQLSADEAASPAGDSPAIEAAGGSGIS